MTTVRCKNDCSVDKSKNSAMNRVPRDTADNRWRRINGVSWLVVRMFSEFCNMEKLFVICVPGFLPRPRSLPSSPSRSTSHKRGEGGRGWSCTGQNANITKKTFRTGAVANKMTISRNIFCSSSETGRRIFKRRNYRWRSPSPSPRPPRKMAKVFFWNTLCNKLFRNQRTGAICRD